MRILRVNSIDSFASKITPKQAQKNHSIVESILRDVSKNGDSAIKKYEKKFGGAKLTTLQVSKKEIKDAYGNVSKNEIAALKNARTKLVKTETKTNSILKPIIINSDGIKIRKNFVPIQSVGCYVPGGIAKYPSSAVMSIIPAKVAGVKRIVVVSPPDNNGKIDPLTIVAADICGATEIYKTGGAQAIAALCYGTKSILPVDKIVGPGGTFVTLAKSIVSNEVAIDMLAGPTELGILADNSANPKLVALDLISQAEHSSDTFCYVITNSQKLAKEIDKEVNKKLKTIQRSKLVKTSLSKNGFIAICNNQNDMISLANQLAPEHLQIMTKNSLSISQKITSAGLILLGNTPSAASDYLLGSNHILPTNGFGKTRGSLSVLDFVKLSTTVSTTRQALKKISKDMKSIAESEGLPNHFESLRGRTK